MAFNSTRPKIRRGIKVQLTAARLEVFKELVTKNGDPFFSAAFYGPVNLDDQNDGEVKYGTTLWKESVAVVKGAPKGSRFNVSGYMKQGKPWTTKDGRTVVSNEFVVETIEPAVKQRAAAPVEEVPWSDDEESDPIPF